MLAELGIRFGAWAFLLLGAFQIYRAIGIGSRISSWAFIVMAVLVVLAIGRITGVITGFDAAPIIEFGEWLFDTGIGVFG